MHKNYKTKLLKKRWDNLAISLSQIDERCQVLLYPLQMQPEANLDVWGNRFRDQTGLIESMASTIPDDWIVVVKPNPKSKYEMSDDLLNLIKNTDNIMAMSHQALMESAFLRANLVVTVTGTVAVECILEGKPLGLLGPSIVSNFKGCHILQDVNELPDLCKLIQDKRFQCAGQEDKRMLCHQMVSTTYPGLVSDPVSNPDCMDSDNIYSVVQSIVSFEESLA